MVVFDQPFRAADIAFLDSVGVALDPQPLHTGRPSFYRNRSALPRARLVGRLAARGRGARRRRAAGRSWTRSQAGTVTWPTR